MSEPKRQRRLPPLGDPKRFITYKVPRCAVCKSHRLEVYKSDSDRGVVPVAQFVECQDCGARAYAVGD